MKLKDSCLLGVSDNAFITPHGLSGMGFELDLFEYSTKPHSTIDDTKNALSKLLHLIGEYIFVVKIDLCFEDTYRSVSSDLGFFQKKSNDYFEGKPFLNYKSYLFFVDIEKAYDVKVLTNPFDFLPVKKLEEKVSDRYEVFVKSVENAVKMLQEKKIGVSAMKGEEVENFLQVYFACGRTNILPTVDFKEQKVDGRFYSVYSINDDNCFPNMLAYYNKNEGLSTSHDNFYNILGDDFGFGLRHEHIYIQTFFKKSMEEVRKKLDKKRTVFGYLKGTTSYNSIKSEKLDLLDNGLGKDGVLMVSGNVTIVSFAKTKEALRVLNSNIETLFTNRGFRFRLLSKDLQNHLFVCSHPFFVSQIGLLNLFDVDESAMLSLWNFSTNYRNEFDAKAIYLCDRFNVPVTYDLWDEGKRKHEAKNLLVVGPTGSSKSTTMNHLVKQLVELNFNLIIVDIGRSYERLALLFKDKAFFVKLKPNEPLGINPFLFIGDRRACLEVDNLTFLTEYLVAHCGLYGEDFVSATSTYFRYFSNVLKTFLGLSLPLDFLTFLEWFVSYYEKLPYENQEIKEVLSSDTGKRDLDTKNYISILKQFTTGGTYGNIYKGGQNISLEGKRLGVFEVEEVQNNPLLYNVFTLAISFVAQKTIWKRKDIPGYYLLDEFQTMAQKKGVLQSVASQYQRARKHSAGMAICIQDFTTVQDSSYFRSIINNSAVKIILDHKGNFDLTAKTLNLNEFQRYVLGSVRNQLSSDAVEKYASMMLLHGNHCKVFHNHLDPYSYFASITDGEDNVRMLQLLGQNMDVLSVIETMIKEKNINIKPYAL